MNVVDSSVWLEYFSGGAKAEIFARVISDRKNLVVPVISIYEVFKKMRAELDDDSALEAVTHMEMGNVVVLDAILAKNAATVSSSLKLPMADALIYATARLHNATLWTMDKHFKDLPMVKYFSKLKDAR